MTRPSLAILCVTVSLWLNSSAQITFQKTFDGGARSISRKTIDGGSVIFTSKHMNGYDYDAFMIRLNSFGDTLWTQTYGGPDVETFVDGLQTSDLGFALTGSTSLPGSIFTHTFLIKTDQNGNVVWSKTFEDSIKYYDPSSITQTTFGEFLITGIMGDTMGMNYADIFVIKVNINGALTWAKIYDRNWQGADYGEFIRETNDHGFIIAATSSYPYDLNLIKLSMNGNVSWNKAYKGNYNINLATAVQQTFDGGFILTGFKRDSTNQADILLIKTDSIGDSSWTRCFGGPDDDYSYWVERSADSGYIICGGFEVSGNEMPFAMKTNAAGDTSWSRIYNAGGYGHLYSAHETGDDDFIFTGFKYSGKSVYHIRTDSNGTSGCNEQFPQLTISYPAIQVSSPSITSTQINPIVSSFAVSVTLGNLMAPLCFSCTIQVEINITGNTIICNGDSVKLEASIPNFSYSWSTGDTTRSIYVSTAGSYSVFAYDSHGCADSSGVINISVSPIASVSYTGLPDTVCNDWPTTILIGVPSGGTFSGPGMTDSTFNPQLANQGWNVIGYQFTDTNGCSNAAYDSAFVEICLETGNLMKSVSPLIAPSPFSSYFKIINAAGSRVTVCNPIGDVILSHRIISEDEVFNTENFPSGIYFIKVQSKNGASVQKLIKQ